MSSNKPLDRRTFLGTAGVIAAGVTVAARGDDRPAVREPRATSGDVLVEPNWDERLTLHVGPDNRLLIQEGSQLSLTEVATGREYRSFVQQSAAGKSVSCGSPAVHPGGRLLVVSGSDRRTRVLDLETGEELTTQVDEIRAGYTAAIAAWQDELDAGCRGRRIDRVTMTTDQPLEQALYEYLTRRSQLF